LEPTCGTKGHRFPQRIKQNRKQEFKTNQKPFIMNVINPQQVIDDFERVLLELTEKRELSLVTTEKAVNICALRCLKSIPPLQQD